MGLDMYLNAKCFIGYDDYNLRNALNEVLGSPGPKITEDNTFDAPHVNVVSYQVGYWRKANHIHQWFVENVQSGEDDCHEYDLSYEQLAELKDLCQKVLKNHKKASTLLPTQGGFFFGGTEYDEYYFGSLEDTVKIIDNITTNFPSDKFYLTYQSSW